MSCIQCVSKSFTEVLKEKTSAAGPQCSRASHIAAVLLRTVLKIYKVGFTLLLLWHHNCCYALYFGVYPSPVQFCDLRSGRDTSV